MDDLLMPNMDSVKSANGNDRGLNLFVISRSFYFQNIVMELIYEDKNKEVIIQFYNKPNIKKNYP